jgi:hypothetical protein
VRPLLCKSCHPHCKLTAPQALLSLVVFQESIPILWWLGATVMTAGVVLIQIDGATPAANADSPGGPSVPPPSTPGGLQMTPPTDEDSAQLTPRRRSARLRRQRGTQ